MADFDEAGELFSDILRRFPNSAEAYWGSTLADYGIKYEDDYDGKKIPTCYAAKYESFVESSTYKKAISCATAEQREYYEAQSRKIDAVRIEWVEKAEKEPPYDVFLSFKDTEDGQRTADSFDAHEIYNILTGLGYRVFFSRVTLADKTGENYEPYIFAALNSAPVMLVYASKKEYVESTWVRNEWNRYLARIRNKQKQEGSICVIFKDPLDPSKLPTSLRRMQNLKRTEITFLDNLREYVSKYVCAAKIKTPRIDRKEIALAKKQGQKSIEAVKVEDVSSISVKKQAKKSINIERRQVGSSTVAALSPSEESKLAQAEIYLSHGDTERAKSLYEDVLNNNPHSQQALVGTLLIRTGFKDLNELLNNPEAVASELDLAATAVDYSEKDTAFLILEALSKACLGYIEHNDFWSGKAIYGKVNHYDVPIVNNLHKKLFLAAVAKAERNEAIALCKLCLPYLSSDATLFRESLEKAIQGTFYAKRYKDCVDFAEQYGQYYDFTADLYKLILAAKEGRSSPGEWLSNIAEKGDFSLLSGGLPLSEKEIGTLFDWASDMAMEMITSKPDSANALVRFLLSYRFPKREEFIEKGIAKCQKKPNEKVAKILDDFLHAYGDERFEEFVAIQEKFVRNCFEAKEYGLASRYLDRLIEYDPDKSERYFLRCCARLGCDANDLSKRIHLLADYSDVEAMIANRGSAKTVESIEPLLRATESSNSLKEACPVFDTIVGYLPKEEDAALLAHLATMAWNCLNASLFDEAERYSSFIVALDPNNHSAYFCILMAKLRASNETELIHQAAPIGDFVEFENAKLAAGKDKEALEHYIEVELKQMQWIESKKAKIAKQEEDARMAAELETRRQKEEEERRRAKKKKTRTLICSFAVAAVIFASIIVSATIFLPKIGLNGVEKDETWKRAHGAIPVFSDDGTYITYGMYPQDEVTDPSLISKLNGSATSRKVYGWRLLDDEYYCESQSSWYTVQPIKWKVLERNGGDLFVVSSLLLDVHRYGVSSNNYKESEIRSWLNGTFFETAFALGNEYVLMTNVDNSAATTDSPSNIYACENTEDKVFLLSYQDYWNTSYGFSDRSSRQCKSSDFAKTNNKDGWYWTRSPSSSLSGHAWYFGSNGPSDYGGRNVDYGGLGVRPGLRITLAE